MQIVQELCKRPSLNRTGFDMPTIYVPTLGKQSRCSNQIEDVSVCYKLLQTLYRTQQRIMVRSCLRLLLTVVSTSCIHLM